MLMERSSSSALCFPQICFILMILVTPSELFALSPPVSGLRPAGGSGAFLEPEEAELWCESCVVSCTMGYSYASCDKGAFYTSVVNGRLGFEVWMHASSFVNITNQSTLAVEQQLPTAYIDAGPAFTNAANLTVKIVLEAPCVGEGFQCRSASSCDLIVTGDGVVLPSTLQSAHGGLLFSLTVALQTQSPTGKVMLALAKGFCSNFNGDSSRSSAAVTIRFDRRPVTVNLWTAIPGALVQINNVSRTIQATNKVAELILYLDFTHPVKNTSEELSNVLKSNYGVFKVLHRKSHGNRRFGFELASVQSPAVVTVSLDTSHIISRAGTIVGQPSPVIFLYDMVRPQVRLTPASSLKTQDRDVPMLIEFTKPVFSFDSQSITVLNGQITSFDEISKSLYTVHVLADEGRVTAVSIKENKTSDITGNFNAHSNVVYVRHYATPAVSIGLYSFTSASLLATSFTAAILAISSASLAAAGALTATTMKSIISDPSRNLLGMAGHLQVFALSEQMAVSLPIEYHETTRGLQWLIPHAQLPWERQGTPSHREFFVVHRKYIMLDKHLDPQGVFCIDALAPVRLPRSKTERGRKLSANASVYGPALLPSEYKSFFQVQNLDPFPADPSLRLSTYKGWHDFASNMFWLGVSGGALTFLHFFILGVLKWRFTSSFRGALLPPRFELFLLIYALPGFCQALAFIIRGGTTIGIIVGVILLAVPAGFLFSVMLFLGVAVLVGRFVQYHEVRWQTNEDAWQKIAVLFVIGNTSIGSWTCKERLPSTFLSRFGLLFEDRKGPPDIVIMDSENSKSLPRWVDSGSIGIGRMKAVNSNDESDEVVVSKEGRIFGAGQASYVVLDLARRTLLGIVFGAYNPADFSWSQVSIVLGTTVIQLLYLLVFRPYIRRGVQAVETISMLCETVLFALGLALLASSPVESNETLGIVMLGLLLLSLVVQLANEWYALMNQLLRLSPSQAPSLKVGIKMLFLGLLLPLIPKGRWSRFMSSLPLQPRTGLVAVVPASPEIDVKVGATSQGDPDVPSNSGAVVLAYGPGSPCFVDPRMAAIGTNSGEITTEFDQGQDQPWSQWDVPQGVQGKISLGTAKSNELKTLRELAKASFPRGSRKDDSMIEMGAAKESFEPLSSMASPSSLLVEQRTPSRAGAALPARTNSEDSLSVDDLEILER